MLDHFQTLLEAIVAHPETPIGSLPLLSAASAPRCCPAGIAWAGGRAAGLLA